MSPGHGGGGLETGTKIVAVLIGVACVVILVAAYVRQETVRHELAVETERSLLLANDRLRALLEERQAYADTLETTVERRNEQIRQLQDQLDGALRVLDVDDETTNAEE